MNRSKIVGLFGESGAGKSTLMKVVYGAHQPDGGEIVIDGRAVRFQNPRQAMDHGIGMVFQEQSLVTNPTVMENVFLGYERQFVRLGVIDWKATAAAARMQLAKVRLDIDPATITSHPSFAQRQMVELARVLTLEERIEGDLVILLDEPTSVLDRDEVDLLFKLVSDLTNRASFVFVSHRIEEVLELSDRVYVMKDGKVVDVVTRENANINAIQHKHPCLESTVFLAQRVTFSSVSRALSLCFPQRESAPLATARGSIPRQARRPRQQHNVTRTVFSPTSFRPSQPVGAGECSTVLVRSSRSKTLARITSLRMTATSATLWYFPRAFSLSYKAFNSGLYVVADKAAMGFAVLSVAKWLSGQRALSMGAQLREASFAWMFGNTAGIPHEIIIAAVLLLATWFIQTPPPPPPPLGRALKAIGAGELAAVASGLNVDRIKIIAFSLSGTLAALSGLIFSVKLSGRDANLANGFLLLAIVAVLVGGTPLTGGVGGVLNTAVGTLIVMVIRAAMVYLEVDATQQQMVFGSLLIVAIAATIDRRKLRGVVK